MSILNKAAKYSINSNKVRTFYEQIELCLTKINSYLASNDFCCLVWSFRLHMFLGSI